MDFGFYFHRNGESLRDLEGGIIIWLRFYHDFPGYHIQIKENINES